MIETAQYCTFFDQSGLDHAIAYLRSLGDDQAKIEKVENLTLYVWFSDMETVCVPFYTQVADSLHD